MTQSKILFRFTAFIRALGLNCRTVLCTEAGSDRLAFTVAVVMGQLLSR